MIGCDEFQGRFGQSARGTQKEWGSDHLWQGLGVQLGFFITGTNNNSQFHAVQQNLLNTYYMLRNVGSLVIRWRNKNRNEPCSPEGNTYCTPKFLYHFVLTTIL